MMPLLVDEETSPESIGKLGGLFPRRHEGKRECKAWAQGALCAHSCEVAVLLCASATSGRAERYSESGKEGDEAAGEVEFGEEGEGLAAAIGVEEGDAVGLDGETGSGSGDVVGDDEVEALFTEFALGLGGRFAGLGGEADEATVPLLGTDGLEDVGIGDEAEDAVHAGLFEFGGGAGLGAPVGDGGGGDEDIGLTQFTLDGGKHIAGGNDIDTADVGRGGELNGAGDKGDGVAGLGGGLGNGEAHTAGGTVGEEANGVDRLARGAGGDEDV